MILRSMWSMHCVQKKKIKVEKINDIDFAKTKPSVKIFNLHFMWTDKEGRWMKVQNDVIGMKTINSGAIMGMDLIRKLGLVYRSRPNKFEFEDTQQSKYDY